MGEKSIATSVLEPEFEKDATVAEDKVANRSVSGSCCTCVSTDPSVWMVWRSVYAHRSLEVSISPNRSLLPPLREVPADVADAAEEETVEKEVDGLLAST